MLTKNTNLRKELGKYVPNDSIDEIIKEWKEIAADTYELDTLCGNWCKHNLVYEMKLNEELKSFATDIF